MRDRCPICGNITRYDDWSMDFTIPDCWTVPSHNTVCCCKQCGFIYYDNDATQADYDQYYKERYGFGLDTVANQIRLNKWSWEVIKRFEKDNFIYDFGGGDGYLARQIQRWGFTNIRTWNIGDETPF